MPKYASFDPSATGATPVVGWYDTDFVDYGTNLPASNALVELTDAQWASHLSGEQWAVENGELVPYVPPPLTNTQLIAAKLSDLAALRYQKEIQGVNFQPGGAGTAVLIASDRNSQSQLSAAYQLAQAGHWVDGAPWKTANGSFIPMTSADVQAMAVKVGLYVGACFAHEAELASGIAPDTDITVGWPSNA